MGTVMSRKSKDPKSTIPAASQEKRSRPNRNPLRRGPSSRDMQTIPSPEESTIHLPSPPPRQEPALSRPTRSPPIEQPEPPAQPQPSNDRSNGDTILSAPISSSALSQTNGVNASRDVAPLQPEPPLPITSVPAEVSTVKIDCRFFY